MKRQLLLVTLITIVCPVLSHAQVKAASCSESDVSKAWATVTSSTTTFTIPSGTCPWTAQLSLTVPSGNANLTIQGSTAITTNCGAPPTYSTACTATDNTVIVDNCTSCGSGPFWQITTQASSTLFRVTGLTVKGGSGGPEYNGMLAIAGYSQNVRVDHNHFNSAAYSPANNSAELVFSGWLYGVADHNVFDSSTDSIGGANNGIGVTMGNYGNNSLGEGDGSWAAATNFGSGNFIFMESNTINYGYADDCGDGGRYVFRYNYLTGVVESQSHPTGGGGRTRGCRATEVYGNVFASGTTRCNGPSNSCQAFMRLTGGASLLWANSEVTSGSYQNGVLFEEMRNGLSYSQDATPAGWGYCGSNYDGTGSNWDGNSPSAATGYPCLDQGGRGQGDMLVGGFTSDGTGSNNVENQTTACLSSSACAYPRQAREPVYEWLDKIANTPVSSYAGSPSSVPYFTENLDYFQSSNPGSGVNCNGFTGATGVGCGVLSARPSACTAGPVATSPYQSYVPGVGYWATDTNTLYVCSATNTWTAYYTPYTYPHPLTQGQGSGNPPAVPTNLQVVVN